MKKIAAIVEGYGDLASIPTLLSKIGNHFGQRIVAPNPIRAGEWPRIRRAGELERLLELAYSRNYDQILIIVDLDDGCVAAESEDARRRVEKWKNQREVVVSVVFVLREYEALFLCNTEMFSVEADDAVNTAMDSEKFRDAKRKIKEISGKRYKETRDQLIYTQQLDMRILYERSRSFRKLSKEILLESYLFLEGLNQQK